MLFWLLNHFLPNLIVYSSVSPLFHYYFGQFFVTIYSPTPLYLRPRLKPTQTAMQPFALSDNDTSELDILRQFWRLCNKFGAFRLFF